MEEVFFFFKVNRFSFFKVKEQITLNKKVYCIDNGYISAKSTQFSPDIGCLYENAVAIELRKHEM